MDGAQLAVIGGNMSVNRFAGRGAVAVAFGVFGIVAGGLGVAAASSGGVFILGEHNAAAATTSLSNSKGTALALKAGHNKAPLTVNNSTEVKKLNAAEVGGSTASDLKTSGSGVTTNYGDGFVAQITNTPTVMAETGALKTGTYYVTGTAFVGGVLGGESARCSVALSTLGSSLGVTGQSGTDYEGLSTLSETIPLAVTTGDKIAEFCWVSGGNSNAVLNSAGITAVRIDSSVAGTVKSSHGG
jgi:hypothetical protein